MLSRPASSLSLPGVDQWLTALYSERSKSIVTSQVSDTAAQRVPLAQDYAHAGTPDLSLTFTNPNVISDPAFHPCIRCVLSALRYISHGHQLSTDCITSSLTRFSQSKVLSFVPPDGHFTLMEYHYLPSAASQNPKGTSTPVSGPVPTPITAAAQAQTQVQIPLTVKPNLRVHENGGM